MGKSGGTKLRPMIAIPFVYLSGRDSPNVPKEMATEAAAVYERALAVAFASLRRWGPDTDLAMVANAAPSPRLSSLLDELGVQFIEQTFEHRPPAGFRPNYLASLYLLDAIGMCESRDTLFLDPDVLCVDEIHLLTAALTDKPAVLPLEYDPQHLINGLSLTDAVRIHETIDSRRVDFVQHLGGEAVYIPRSSYHEIRNRLEVAWRHSLEAFSLAEAYFTTEEHLLSYALRDVPSGDLSPMIRRISTASIYRTVKGDESSLVIWHLPTEKGRGFDALAQAAADRSGWFWTCNRGEFVERSGRAMGLHHRSPWRVARDLVGHTAVRVGLR